MQHQILKKYFVKKIILKKWEKIGEKWGENWLTFYWVVFHGRRPMEDNLANNFTSLHFPDACVTSK